MNATTTALPVMVGLFRWLTMLAWLILFAVYWGAGTRSFITHAGHSSPRDRISMLVMAFGALALFGSMVIVLLGSPRAGSHRPARQSDDDLRGERLRDRALDAGGYLRSLRCRRGPMRRAACTLGA